MIFFFRVRVSMFPHINGASIRAPAGFAVQSQVQELRARGQTCSDGLQGGEVVHRPRWRRSHADSTLCASSTSSAHQLTTVRKRKTLIDLTRYDQAQSPKKLKISPKSIAICSLGPNKMFKTHFILVKGRDPPQSMMNAKLSLHGFWHCNKIRLINTIQKIPDSLFVSFKPASLY